MMTMETSMLNGDENTGNEETTAVEDSRGTTTDVRIPIVGFEVMDERARFTVFKLKIENEKLGDSWLVFRRYTDFVRLHNKLKEEFPNLNIPLPPKRWLRDNFEPAFLEDRMKGLQAFVDSILLLQPNLTQSPTVREFFCLDEPPVYPENAEETRAMFGTVEENIMHMKQQLTNKDLEMEILKAELALVTSQRDNIIKSIKSCKNCSHKVPLITENDSKFGSATLNATDATTVKTGVQPVPTPASSRMQCNGSSSDLSSSSSLTADKSSLNGSPKVPSSVTASTSPKLNGNCDIVIKSNAPGKPGNGSPDPTPA